MGEKNVELIEQSVQNNVEDIREIKKRLDRAENDVHDLKANQQVTNQSITHVMDMLTDLKAGFKELDNKLDASNDEQLRQYKTAVWQVGGTIIATIIGAAILFIIGI